MIRNKNYRREMARRARERALMYTSERMGKKYMAAYAELLALTQSFRRQESFAQCA